MVGTILCLGPLLAAAQGRGSAAPPGNTGGGLSGGGRATGVEDKDDLKDFHEALAMQATAAQIAQYEGLLKSTQAAQSELKTLLEAAGNGGAAPQLIERNAALDRAIDKARTENKNFLETFSDKQRSGLKEITKNLTRAESEMAQQGSKLEQLIRAAAGSEVAEHAATLDKSLADYYDQQIAMGREMNIGAANPPRLVFTLPPVKTPVSIGGQSVALTASGALSQVDVSAGLHTFQLDLSADLTDLQQNATQVLRTQLHRSETCGQRVDIRQATVTPSAPAGIVSISLHFERWTCIRSLGQPTSTELAEGDGSFEVKLTPTVQAHVLKLEPEFGRIDASGMLGESLRSGALGEDLRDKVAETVLFAMQAATDFKRTLPAVARDATALETAKFLDAGAGVLRLVLVGKVQLSDEQTKLLASQLKETLSAQGTPSQ